MQEHTMVQGKRETIYKAFSTEWTTAQAVLNLLPRDARSNISIHYVCDALRALWIRGLADRRETSEPAALYEYRRRPQQEVGSPSSAV